MSPGTSSSDGIKRGWAARMTLAEVVIARERASMAPSALDSWTNPMIALTSTTAKIAVASDHSEISPVVTPAARRM